MRVDSNRWGIIYVPKAGVSNAQKRWCQIRDYLELRKVEYDYIQSEGPGSIERITRMLIEGGYRTIVVVGGDEALNDVINAIMYTPKDIRNEICLGLVPNGIGNDFARFWGLTVDNYKQAIHWIIERRVQKIDVGYCSYRENDEEKVRYFLMSVHIGLSAQAIKLSDLCKKLGLKNPAYLFSMLGLMTERKQYKMRLKVNGEELNEKVMTLCIGNTSGYGLTPSAVPYNGWIDISVVARPEFMKLIQGVRLMTKGQFLNHKDVKPFRSKSVVVTEVEGAPVCLDGHSMNPTFPITVSLEPGVLNFIIPN